MARTTGSKNTRTTYQSMTLSKLARTHSAKAIKTLAEICADKKAPASARISASVAILDRAYGKPKETMEVFTPPGEELNVNHSVSLIDGARRIAYVLAMASKQQQGK